MTAIDVMTLPVPRSPTALMQLLQLLVGKESHRLWCGGIVPPEKLEAFARKMAARYPAICRNARQRSYDRKVGRAPMHFIAFASEAGVHWWLLSGTGKGGLGDPTMPDHRVARDAMAAAGHIEFGDYVLLYATKKEPRELVDKRTKKPRTVLKDTSTWTWKLRRPVVAELEASVEQLSTRLEYGAEGASPWGIRGLLVTQRCRPLFSGVRNQVIALHRLARDSWERARPRWCARNANLASRYGAKAGALRPLKEVLEQHMPKMPRLPVYDDPPRCLRDLAVTPIAPQTAKHAARE